MFGLLCKQLLSNVRSFERGMAFYAVAKGRKVGIYANWTQCEQQVKGFKGAIYKKFNTRQEAEEFVNPNQSGACQNYAAEAVSKQEQHTDNADYWPEDVEHTEDAVTEEDLMAAMNEVEGFTTSATGPKRKAYDDGTALSKSKHPRHVCKVEEIVALKQIGGHEFSLDSGGYVIVYTDGSCLNNGRTNACAGFGVYFGDDHELNAAKPVLGRVTNNVGEIQAAIYAIKTALDLGIEKLSICTDSQFLINSITMWVPGWKRRGWRLKNNEPVKNVADFKELDELLQNDEIRVKWNYVEAHKGIKGNEMADKLAREGSQIYKELNRKRV
ncbi:ribonuclease H1 [Drosophila busckii]|uniref:ribonuclease H1 n=1 Tax=Drosophila busckii TaxID=30019 RepID=UPI00083EA35E|nr:ribonuclease H1 [Drosophila busckii]